MSASITPPPPPRIRLSLGVTGHRADNPAYAANRARIEATLTRVLDFIGAALETEPEPFGPGSIAPARVHSLLADGADQRVAHEAIMRGWELIAPLPFGAALNCAINAAPTNAADARALIAGGDAADAETQARAMAIRALYGQARLFELADDDPEVEAAFLTMHDAPDNGAAAQIFAADSSLRVALAAKLVIEQSDFIIAVWDGERTSLVGGTGHTVAAALEMGAPVIWIDAAAPEDWRILRAPESLACLRTEPPGDDRAEQVARLVREALRPVTLRPADLTQQGEHLGVSALDAAHWRARSSSIWHAYRRIEALFSGEKGRNPLRSLRQVYETPDAVGAGSGADMLNAARALPGADPGFAQKLESDVLGRFAWADGISSHLSDTYRGGMVVNFVLSGLAIVVGMAYLPFADAGDKWIFALIEFVLLSAILLITFYGRKKRWHGRWFETRRVAEYLRHGPLLLALGAARAPGRWPRGAETAWPEWYARHALRDVGLPRVVITPAYLRHALVELLDKHVTVQRDYHHGKAHRLTAVHNNLDRFSVFLFQLAVLSVAAYLAMKGASTVHLIDNAVVKECSKFFTFLGVLFPTFGGAVAGIRYFGDFERFAAISEVTAEKLDAIHARIGVLLAANDAAMDYGPVAELAHAADEIVVSEVESWQAVFGGKHVTVPV